MRGARIAPNRRGGGRAGGLALSLGGPRLGIFRGLTCIRGLGDQAKQQMSLLRDKEAENNFVIAKFYEKQKNLKAARIYYKEVIRKYDDTPWAVKASARLKVIGE